MNYKRVIVTGSIAFDHIMSMPGRFGDHIMADKIHMLNVSFFMDTFRKEFGGTGGNIAYSLAMLGVPTVLVGAVGNDFEDYQKHLNSLKTLDSSGIKTFSKLATAQGFAMTDRDDNQIWGFYTGALRETAKVKVDSFLKKNTLLVIAPNDVLASMNYVKAAISKKVDYIFDPAFNIPYFSEEDLKLAVSGATILMGNDYEIELIKRRLGWSETEFYDEKRIVITTLGKEGSTIRRGIERIVVPVAQVESAIDPTGAGDAYRSGMIAGLMADKSWLECGRMGAVCAAYTVEKYGTQTHSFTLKSFRKRYQENFGT